MVGDDSCHQRKLSRLDLILHPLDQGAGMIGPAMFRVGIDDEFFQVVFIGVPILADGQEDQPFQTANLPDNSDDPAWTGIA
jgi:hypothetical protein